MPLDYNNVNTPFYSEAVRTWSAPQDWTVSEVSVLTLFVRSAAGNAAERLYVILEDSSGHSAEVASADATVGTVAKWTEWRIPLTDFTGVNLNKVKRLWIGVGDKAGTTPDGTGRIYIDDICLTTP
jgi:hypothetical protein